MAAPNQNSNKPILTQAVYNGSTTAITAGYALAFDASYPPETYGAPGVKLTTGDTDFVAIALTDLPATGYGSAVFEGIADGVAGGTVTFGTTLSVMSDSSGKLVTRTTGLRGAGVPMSSAVSGGIVKIHIKGPDAT